jgi:hypothetical protein
LILIIGVHEARATGSTWMGVALQQAMDAAKWKLGPFKINPVLILSDIGYDTNIYYGYSSKPIKDYTLTAGPVLTVYLPLKKKVIFEIDESPQYVHYLRTKSERTWNNYFDAKVYFALNRLFITVGKGLSDARQRWSTEIDIRPRRKQDSWEGSILLQATKKTSFFVQGTRTTYDFENLAFGAFNIRDRLNRREERLSFRTYYQFTYRTRFFADAEYGNYHFLNSVSSFKNSRSFGLYGGFEFSPSAVVRGRINLGYKVLEPLNKTITRYAGLSGDSEVSVRIVRFLTVRGSYARDIQFSVWYDNPYFLESRAGGGASLYIFKKVRFDYDYWDGRNRYPEVQSVSPGTDAKRRDDYVIHSVGLYFRLKKNIGIGLVASRWNRKSNLVLENANRDFIGMNLTYDF